MFPVRLTTRAETCKFRLHFFSFSLLDVSIPPPILLSATKLRLDRYALLHFQRRSNQNLPSISPQPFVRDGVGSGGECVLVITRQFEPSAEAGRPAGGLSARCSLSRWVEMNNSTMSVWVPSASQDLIVSECRVHLAWPSLALSVCLFVTWPLSASTHNLAVCEIRSSCSVSALCLQPC